MTDLRWMRWRRYPGGPLQRWHLIAIRNEGKGVICCGSQPGEFAVDGGNREGDDMPDKAVCKTCKAMHPVFSAQVKGWT